jgi:hypothetical protein
MSQVFSIQALSILEYAANDIRLSFSAIGLLSFLAINPEHQTLSLRGIMLARRSNKIMGDDGYITVKHTMQELLRLGYVVEKQERLGTPKTWLVRMPTEALEDVF